MPRPLVLGRAWLPAEDALLLKAVDKYGPSWTAICRNRYQRIKAPLQEGKEGRNRCKRCGQIKRGHTCTADDVAALPLPAATVEVASAPLEGAANRGRVAPARTGAGARRKAVVSFAPTAVDHRGRVGGELAGDDDVLPDTPVCPPPSGNDFKIDVDAFLASVNGFAGGTPAVDTEPARPPAAAEDDADDAAPRADAWTA